MHRLEDLVQMLVQSCERQSGVETRESLFSLVILEGFGHVEEWSGNLKRRQKRDHFLKKSERTETTDTP